MSSRGRLVITGTSTGIGRACALMAVRAGYRVYAGVRTQKDMDSWGSEGMQGLVPVLLDVTKHKSIQQVVERVESDGPHGNFALVNNAGLYVAGPLETQPLEDAERLMNVNVLGLLATTRAFLPLLRSTKGVLVNISSISGLVALPGVSYYAATKFATEAITDSLRVELAPFGVRCVAIEPGNIQTAIWEKVQVLDKQKRAQGSGEVEELYGPLLRYIHKYNAEAGGIPAERVGEVLLKILNSSSPRPRYLVGMDARVVSWLRWFPTGVRDWLLRRLFRL